MRAIDRRLRRLELRLAPVRDPAVRTVVDRVWERCRRTAQERGIELEVVMQEHRAAHDAFWEGYNGPGTIVGKLLYARNRRKGIAALNEHPHGIDPSQAARVPVSARR